MELDPHVKELCDDLDADPDQVRKDLNDLLEYDVSIEEAKGSIRREHNLDKSENRFQSQTDTSGTGDASSETDASNQPVSGASTDTERITGAHTRHAHTHPLSPEERQYIKKYNPDYETDVNRSVNTQAKSGKNNTNISNSVDSSPRGKGGYVNDGSSDPRRLFKAIAQNIKVTKIDDQSYSVNGSRGKDYKVNLQAGWCQCEDWRKRQPEGGCKHILAVKIERNGGNKQIPRCKGICTPPSNSRIKDRIIERDYNKCQKCNNSKSSLEVHQLKNSPDGFQDETDIYISVCKQCHDKIHFRTDSSKMNSVASVDENKRENTTNRQEVQSQPTSNESTESGGVGILRRACRRVSTLLPDD